MVELRVAMIPAAIQHLPAGMEDKKANLLPASRLSWTILLAACLGALLLRVYRLAIPALRWDEGWTVAHGQLPWPELARIAALEWHPPLFYLLYKIWQSLVGVNVYAVRYLAVLAGVLTVPLTWVAARAWTSDRRVAMMAVLCNAVLPLLVYYGQVNRMYAWTAPGILLATWALLRATADARLRWPLAIRSGITTVLALYLLYSTIWPLLALYLYVLLTRYRSWRATLLSGAVALLLYAPWLLYAAETLQSRIQPAPLANSLRGMAELIGPSLFALVFAYGREWTAVWVVAGLLAVGPLLPPRHNRHLFLLPVLGMGLAIVGVSYGAQAVRFFAARHLVPAAPFLGLALAWALGKVYDRLRWWGLALAVALLLATFWPVRTAVYAKMLEVVDPFDPAADWRYLSSLLRHGDIVFFNNLAKAGWYEASRDGQGPPWSYTLPWEPTVEPLPVIAERVDAAIRYYSRLWFVLYKGTIGANNDLRAWLSVHPLLYPMWEGWADDALILGYVVPQMPLVESSGRGILVNGAIALARARFTPVGESGVAVELEWLVRRQLGRPVKVFVHLMSEDGRLVAQHDVRFPEACLFPPEPCTDRHGVGLPADTAGSLTARVGLYDEGTGERMRWDGGGEFLVLGQVEVKR